MDHRLVCYRKVVSLHVSALKKKTALVNVVMLASHGQGNHGDRVNCRITQAHFHTKAKPLSLQSASFFSKLKEAWNRLFKNWTDG